MPLLLGNKMLCFEKSVCLIVFLSGFNSNDIPENKFWIALVVSLAGVMKLGVYDFRGKDKPNSKPLKYSR